MDDIFDIVIVGAGISALAFIDGLQCSELKIGLISGGVSTADAESIDKVIGNHFPLADCSNKEFGGTSKTWGGRCVDFDKVDFSKRSWIDGEWPINKGCVAPFYDSACRFMSIAPAIFESDREPHFNSTLFSDRHLERWSPPLRLHKSADAILAKHGNLTFFNNFHVTSVEQLENTYKIYADGEDAPLLARTCVLAAGGIGVTKILLNSLDAEEYRALGKYYQGHVSGKIADIVFENPKSVKPDFSMHNGVFTRWRFQPTEELLFEHQLLNCALWLDNPSIFDSTHRNATLSLVYLIMRIPFLKDMLAPPSIRRAIVGGERVKIWPHIRNVFRALPSSLLECTKFAFKKYLGSRKKPGFFLFSENGRYAIHFHAEQEPRTENQISSELNGFKIQYHYSDYDCQSVIELHKLLDLELRRTGVGRLEFYEETEDDLIESIRFQSIDGIHQIGTARMSDSIKTGVVDKNLQVFGKSNLYVLSSAVFPTSGQANPTFLLTAFAYRLAEHLRHIWGH